MLGWHIQEKPLGESAKRLPFHPKNRETRTHSKLPPAYRIFVNRNLRLEKIRFFGFDLDYTLAVYKSPQFELAAFKFTIERLIGVGYPEELRSFQYKTIFPVRGLWFDYLYGNLLKVDGFGNILVGIHGFHFMKPSEIEDMYPNKFIHLSPNRIYVLNTLFNLPETYLVAALIDFFDNNKNYKRSDDHTGVKSGEVFMTYQSIFQDTREAVNWVHHYGDLKKTVLNDLNHYVCKDPRIKQLLIQIRESGKQSFLLTNSDYSYTSSMMTYLVGHDWTSYFDITVVDAGKPKWFAEGTVFREVDVRNGALEIGVHTGPLRHEKVYSGGSCDAFRRLLKLRGKDVLYIGDHIFGDVLKSKKTRGWRTMLVIPELNQELSVWIERRPLFVQLEKLDAQLAKMYKDIESHTRHRAAIANILESIRKLTHEMDSEYGMLGSLFRSGSRTTFFASQVQRYADIYTANCCNLTNYPLFYFFRAPMTLMPHESTVDQIKDDELSKNAVSRCCIAQHHNYNVKDGPAFCHLEDDEDSNKSDKGSNSSSSFVQQQEGICNEGQMITKPSSNSDIVTISMGHVDQNIPNPD
ncbi:hypothetical protein AB6A40_001269 [Gnathostoma spinigerum]|uniref:Uncharacterized protein n=1 Tax=Gnathostoma spinigerum TaxID=75299 RepID=A0ABD6E4S6_9BILA